jgi:hypothetical protein
VVPGVIQRLEAADGDAMITVIAGEEFYVRDCFGGGAAWSREQSQVFLIKSL